MGLLSRNPYTYILLGTTGSPVPRDWTEYQDLPVSPSQSNIIITTMHLTGSIAGLVALAVLGNGQITKVNDFPGTPTKLGMYVKVPKNLKTPAPIVVAVHHCQGSASGYSGSTKYQPLADQHGFILIYPNSKSGGGCFDVASTASKSMLTLPRL